jgi:hypothetical protein
MTRVRSGHKMAALEFLRTLKAGKEVADARVERSLYNRAVGYSYDSEKIFMPAGAKEPVRVPIVVHVPPDVTAQIFWLKNRDPARWRDAWNIDVAAGHYLISDHPMTMEDWARERAKVELTEDDVKPIDVTQDVTPGITQKVIERKK